MSQSGRDRVSAFGHGPPWPEIALGLLAAIAVIVMMVPVPTVILDVLITANIGLSILILFTAVHVSEPLAYTTFPTLLLITTLVRVGLNVAATRLVLLDADAGRVIDAFGRFVVSGNLVVGLVVFTIITIVQFVVIARGSQRVAEVAARFTLDAMPGKQLAIDADLRSGTVDRDEAGRRRKRVEREGQMYGAMDGAMKFVLGDAIASLVILTVNLVGGTLIGVFQKGMGPSSAISTYGLLTVGQGLSQQIPALLVSTAAGLIVTRVAPEDRASVLGTEIRRQILSNPQTLGMVAGLLLVLGLLPGLPLFPFAAMAGIAAIATWGARSVSRSQRPHDAAEDVVPAFPPIRVEISQDGLETCAPDLATLETILTRTVNTLRMNTGVPFPVPEVRVIPNNEAWCRLWIRGLRAGEIDHSNHDGVTSARDALEDLVRSGLLRNAAVFMGIEETRALLSNLEANAPSLAHEILSKPSGLARLSSVLKALASEGVSLGDIHGTVEAFLEADTGQASPQVVTERVRSLRRGWISDQVSDPDGVLRPVVLSPDLEAVLADALRPGRTVEELALSPDLADHVRGSIENLYGPDAPLVLTLPALRRPLRDLLAAQWPEVRVVSTDEVDPGMDMAPIGVIQLP